VQDGMTAAMTEPMISAGPKTRAPCEWTRPTNLGKTSVTVRRYGKATRKCDLWRISMKKHQEWDHGSDHDAPPLTHTLVRQRPKCYQQ